MLCKESVKKKHLNSKPTLVSKCAWPICKYLGPIRFLPATSTTTKINRKEQSYICLDTQNTQRNSNMIG